MPQFTPPPNMKMPDMPKMPSPPGMQRSLHWSSHRYWSNCTNRNKKTFYHSLLNLFIYLIIFLHPSLKRYFPAHSNSFQKKFKKNTSESFFKVFLLPLSCFTSTLFGILFLCCYLQLAQLNSTSKGACFDLSVPFLNPRLRAHWCEDTLEILARFVILSTDLLAAMEINVGLVAVFSLILVGESWIEGGGAQFFRNGWHFSFVEFRLLKFYNWI